MAEKAKWLNTVLQAVNYQIDQEFNKEPIKTLGEIILLLKQQPQRNKVVLDFDDSFNGFSLTSYRGYYQFLALDYTVCEKPNNTVGKLLSLFEDAIGKEFTGYKGGQFKMHSKTIVFVSYYGLASQRMLVDIKTEGKITTIYTKIHKEQKDGR